MALAAVSLDDKYDLAKQPVLVSGSEAVVRLMLMQRARDRRQGKNTAGYVTGYRGAPLAGLDKALWGAAGVLQPAGIVFNPAVNEALAATALWGTQQAELRGDGRGDGVFGLWYGTGSGVDRAGDGLKHANLAGTSPWGGVLALIGDDHECAFADAAHQSEHALVDAMIPVLAPAGLQEILDYGLFGYALSRYAGTWVALKCVGDTVAARATVDGALDRVATVIPGGFRMAPGGLSIRAHDDPLAQEERLHDFKIPAVLAFVRANKADRVVFTGGRQPRIGIVTAGKSHLDVLQALDDLGIDQVRAAELGLRLLKIACTWPLEPRTIRAFAEGLQTIIVVEEKRGLIEGQIREMLYGTANQPVILGKKNEEGGWLFPSKGTLDINAIALAIGGRLAEGRHDEPLARRLSAVRRQQEALAGIHDIAERAPTLCAGCPHNVSTAVPEGARAYAGAGCGALAVDVAGRRTQGATQMGGEGASWIGEAPFSIREHMIQNLGDGTYVHSGSLAVRAAVAANVNITFKILFNDAAALTGGQKPEGAPTVAMVAAQVLAEGARKVAVVSEEPKRYAGHAGLPAGTTVHHRDRLDAVQRDLAKVAGVSVLIYDQTCAAETRRRRKRGSEPAPSQRVLINELVCEGCGDCGVQSNCVAIQPLETEFGRKRVIDQSACNQDFSCLKGFCPSFVTVHGAVPKAAVPAPEDEALPDPPALPALNGAFAILLAGIGGTGIVTIGRVLAMAAHLEGKAAAVVDVTGLAQKGGPVTSHVRIASRPEAIKAVRIAAGGADLLIGGDAVVAGSASALAAIDPGHTAVFVNSHETYSGAFAHDPDYTLPMRRIVQAITNRAGAPKCHFIEASEIATALMGDAIATNMFLLGLAWQAGAVPLSHFAILKAIALNGVDVAMNQAAFAWGRRAAAEPEVIVALAAERSGRRKPPAAESLDELTARRTRFLTEYQDERYAQRYADAVAAMHEAETRVAPGRADLAQAVALNLYRLMAVKDVYEVARLYTDGSFDRQLGNAFAGWGRLEYHLVPPLFAGRDKASGHRRQRTYGPGILRVLRFIARHRQRRGSWLDPFGHTRERRMERRLVAEYEATLTAIHQHLAPENHHLAVALARYPEKIRGFGHVKAAAVERVRTQAAARRAAFLAGGTEVAAPA